MAYCPLASKCKLVDEFSVDADLPKAISFRVCAACSASVALSTTGKIRFAEDVKSGATGMLIKLVVVRPTISSSYNRGKINYRFLANGILTAVNRAFTDSSCFKRCLTAFNSLARLVDCTGSQLHSIPFVMQLKQESCPSSRWHLVLRFWQAWQEALCRFRFLFLLAGHSFSIGSTEI